VKFTGVLLNSSVDALDGRYSPQRENPEPPPDFDEDLDRDDPEGD
jgi:hypothetical protein